MVEDEGALRVKLADMWRAYIIFEVPYPLNARPPAEVHLHTA